MSKSKSPTEWLHDTLIRLIADTDDSMEFVGSVFNPKDSAQRKVSKSLERAEQAILNHVEALIERTIFVDGEKPYEAKRAGDAAAVMSAASMNGLRNRQHTLAKQLLKGKD